MALSRNFLLASLAGLEIILAAAEAAVVLVPLGSLYPATRAQGNWYLLLVAGLALWGVVTALWLRPLLGGHDSWPGREIYRKTLAVPRRALVLRQVLWAAAALGLVLPLLSAGALAPGQAFTVVTICLVHSLVVGLARWALHHRMLRAVMQGDNLLPPWLELQVDTLRGRLAEIAVLVAVVGGAFLCLFTLLFVPLSVEQYRLVETYFPWAVVSLGLFWYLGVAPRQLSALTRYLAAARDGQPVDRELMLGASHTSHGLPQQAAVTKIVFFVAAGLALVLQAVTLLDISPAKAGLVLVAAVIVSMGCGIYEMIWCRAELRPVVTHMMALPNAEQHQVRGASLRLKMLLSFGGIVLFTLALALFWTFLHHQNLRREFAAQQAQRIISPVMESLRRQPPPQVPGALATLRPPRGSRFVFVPASGPAPAALSPTRLAEVRHRQRGVLELPGPGLVGAYARVVPGDASQGSVVLLLPVDARPAQTLSLVGLAFFFGMVLAVAMGVVLLTATELTRPLGALERRAAEMTAGQLTGEVGLHGEFDTSGRLSSAFEQMRQTLLRKLRDIEQLNEELEQKVRLRTAELEQTNSELVQAIDALQQTQQQLVLSEKMASVGQLVAGIAHEINNPINAVVNTVGPMSSTLEELAGAEVDSDDAAECRADLEQMLKVIRSGVARTQRIVHALRNYSRQDAESMATMDLPADIDETLALLQHSLRGVEVDKQLDGPKTLMAYRGQLNQALMNLLANAADALEGQPDARIEVRTSARDGQLVIEVQDNGPGVPQEVQARIFDPFFTTKDVGKGTGLGLSITHEIVARHNGTLKVVSEPGCTVFALEIPLAGGGDDDG